METVVFAWVRRCTIVLAALLCDAGLCGCRSTYYNTMEAFGQHKRDILVDRVEEARNDQEQAKEQFRSALDAFSEVVGYEGGDLREAYDRLSDELETAEGRAEDVRERIDSVERVATDLFEEWEKELEEYESADLRRRSEDQLEETRERYDDLIDAMHRAESKMDPVLEALRDQVLFLKHNLNARAVASLEGEVDVLESDVEALITDMETAIEEANAFIEGMTAGGNGG